MAPVLFARQSRENTEHRNAVGSRVACVAMLLATAVLPVLAPAAQAQKPTVAVMYFTNGAIGNNADYAPLSKGLAEMMITELSGNTGIRVVERDRLQALLEEQNLGAAGRIEKETAAKVGKTLGAQHMLMGAFVIDPKGSMRMDVRAINTETSELEYATSVTGKADQMLSLLADLGRQVNSGLKLPARVGSAPSEGVLVGAKGPNQLRSMMLLSRALEAQDSKNTTTAVALMKESIQANPDNSRAKSILASMEKPR
jgi:curli biogenesis system outer membrane secretion channel CsgG